MRLLQCSGMAMPNPLEAIYRFLSTCSFLCLLVLNATNCEASGYVITLKNGTIIKRLGYLMGILKIDKPKFISELNKYVSPGIMTLDPSKEIKSAEISRGWNLYINVNPANSTDTNWQGNNDTTSLDKDILTIVHITFALD